MKNHRFVLLKHGAFIHILVLYDTTDSMEAVIMKLNDIKNNQNLVDLIDWI